MWTWISWRCAELIAAFWHSIYFLLQWIITQCNAHKTYNIYFNSFFFSVSAIHCETTWNRPEKAKIIVKKKLLTINEIHPLYVTHTVREWTKKSYHCPCYSDHIVKLIIVKLRYFNERFMQRILDSITLYFARIGEKLCQYDLVACTRNKSFIQYTKKKFNISYVDFCMVVIYIRVYRI